MMEIRNDEIHKDNDFQYIADDIIDNDDLNYDACRKI